MCDGDFHEFMKEYMEKTCPTNGWDRFEHQLEQYRDLSKALKLLWCATSDEEVCPFYGETTGSFSSNS
jgi:hypothetical protein